MKIDKCLFLNHLIILMLFTACHAGQKLQQKEALSNSLLPDAQETFNAIASERVAHLNETIRTEAMDTPEKMMKAYVQEYEGEGFGAYHITEQKQGRKRQIIFTQEGLPDDSIRGRKVVMMMQKNKNHWEVLSIKENFKCAQQRGHQEWGTTPCL
ncbi:MAG: hypothetical protein HC912_00255 [Saprospiraceae bacterium]|nr:hypothetical protein [Saprospiraceae bacterium]